MLIGGRTLVMIALIASALGHNHACAAPAAAFAPGYLPKTTSDPIAEVKRRVFERINRDRHANGLPPVQWDDTASSAGDRHCREMLQGHYGSHWNTRGLKPYTRYSLVGGTDYVEENVSVRDVVPAQSAPPMTGSVIAAALELQAQMMAEHPPDDAHRRNILKPAHTHVGIGLAVDGSGLRMTQEFLNRYVMLTGGLVTTASLSDTVQLRGRLINPADTLQSIDVLYEPFPKPMSVAELKNTSGYGFPDDRDIFRPIAKEGFRYSDGSMGSIRTGPDGSFECALVFRRGRPGLYTLVVWVRPRGAVPAVPATSYSIQVIADKPR
jgi:uncharacterized protein YkwD